MRISERCVRDIRKCALHDTHVLHSNGYSGARHKTKDAEFTSQGCSCSRYYASLTATIGIEKLASKVGHWCRPTLGGWVPPFLPQATTLSFAVGGKCFMKASTNDGSMCLWETGTKTTTQRRRGQDLQVVTTLRRVAPNFLPYRRTTPCSLYNFLTTSV